MSLLTLSCRPCRPEQETIAKNKISNEEAIKSLQGRTVLVRHLVVGCGDVALILQRVILWPETDRFWETRYYCLR